MNRQSFSPVLIGCCALLFAASLFAQPQKGTAQQSDSFQWTMQDSGTTVGLRGIYSVDGRIAWASGTEGTVLRTTDGGAHWTKCAVPYAEKDGTTLDFRGVQADDENTALVLSIGKGALSRIYRTDDGCLHWRLLFKNPESDGFWDVISIWGWAGAYAHKPKQVDGWILGDPVDGHIRIYKFDDGYADIVRRKQPIHDLSLRKDETESLKADAASTGAFAASNSAFVSIPWKLRDEENKQNGTIWPFSHMFVTGGISGAHAYTPKPQTGDVIMPTEWIVTSVPVGSKTASSGAISVALNPDRPTGIIVGGDYTKPNESNGTAAWTSDGGMTWTASIKPPHGFRSAVAWSEELKAWIAAGTNGSDISRDDGKTWTPIDDGNWNALSLPFVVGPHGRIARLSLLSKQ